MSKANQTTLTVSALTLLVLCFTGVVPATSASPKSVPDFQIVITTPTQYPVSIFCLPNGGGSTLATAQTIGHGVVDAIITMQLLDSGNPVANFPHEDMWLDSVLGGLAICLGGTVADGSTDAQGHTSWQSPLQVGGTVDPGAGDFLMVYVNGSSFPSPELAEYRINSADINGDRNVNLSDIPIFASDFHGSYDYRSDFQWDNVINLSDVVKMAQSLGADCP